MISLRKCPRCEGAVLERPAPATDSPMCIICGWRGAEIPAHVQTQVEAHLGEPFIEDRYTHTRIGTGKPALSGWERLKRRRVVSISSSLQP